MVLKKASILQIITAAIFGIGYITHGIISLNFYRYTENKIKEYASAECIGPRHYSDGPNDSMSNILPDHRSSFTERTRKHSRTMSVWFDCPGTSGHKVVVQYEGSASISTPEYQIGTIRIYWSTPIQLEPGIAGDQIIRGSYGVFKSDLYFALIEIFLPVFMSLGWILIYFKNKKR
jgi:hypothetical protein